MKKVLLVTASLIALGVPAVAADLAARPYTKAPPMVAAVYDWTGFYIGANGGWGSSRNSWDLVGFGPEGSHDATGGTIGGQVGYRWQAGAFVFGLEAQGNWADFSGNNVSLQNNAFRNHTNVDAFGLFTGQVGYAVNNVLLYVKGGAAVTANSYRVTNVVGGGLAGVTGDDTRWGGTIGAGLEYAFAPNWSVGVEYNHLFMQDRTYNFTTPV
jgi:outer membrane immunogenic protein